MNSGVFEVNKCDWTRSLLAAKFGDDPWIGLEGTRWPETSKRSATVLYKNEIFTCFSETNKNPENP